MRCREDGKRYRSCQRGVIEYRSPDSLVDNSDDDSDDNDDVSVSLSSSDCIVSEPQAPSLTDRTNGNRRRAGKRKAEIVVCRK